MAKRSALAGPLDVAPEADATPKAATTPPAPKLAITKPGVYALTNERYHADPCAVPSLSSSGARKLMQDPPAVFWHERQNPKPRTAAMNFGSGAHEWLLEPSTFKERHFILPEDHNSRTNAGKELVAEAEGRGLRVLKAEEWTALQAMREAVAAHPYAMAAFEGGQPEASLIWRDPKAGVMCRAKPDYIPGKGRIYADYKTTRSVRTLELQRTIADYGYHQQASWYSDGFRELGLCERAIMLFVFQEKTAPYLVRCVTLGQPSLMIAEEANDKARRIFGVCVKSGEWPGYVEDIQALDLPGWELARAEKAGASGAFEITDAERELLP